MAGSAAKMKGLAGSADFGAGVDLKMNARFASAEEATAAKTVPLGRVGRLKEVGYLAVFLASPAAAYVTGQTWAVDGGVSIQSA